MCVRVYLCVCVCDHLVQKGGIWSLAAGILGACERPDIGTGIYILIFDRAINTLNYCTISWVSLLLESRVVKVFALGVDRIQTQAVEFQSLVLVSMTTLCHSVTLTGLLMKQWEK